MYETDYYESDLDTYTETVATASIETSIKNMEAYMFSTSVAAYLIVGLLLAVLFFRYLKY